MGEMPRVAIVHAVCHPSVLGEKHILKTMQTSYLEPSQTLPYASLPWADVNVSFLCNKCIYKYNKFQ